MSRELQPPILSASLVKIELPTVIKNELPESEIMETGINDTLDSSESEVKELKDIDIAYHQVCGKSIKSEILESYHCEFVETQVLVKAENISQRNNQDTNDENVTKGTDQVVVEVQDSNEHSNALSNFKTDEQYVLNFSKNVNCISVSSRKCKSSKKTDFAKCHKTVETTSWEKDKEKINVIKAHVIPVEAHEYISLAKDRHVCNHCQYACNRLDYVKLHIKKMHREVTTMYQCPYCPHKSKWGVQDHIILMHKDAKDIQWSQCNLCEMKFKLKGQLTRHMKVHLTLEQMQDLKRYDCNECGYETYKSAHFKRHNLVHLKPEEIEYFYCYHCSYKSKQKSNFKNHLFRRHFKNVTRRKRHHCDMCDYKTYTSTNLKNHKLNHLKPEEIQHFYCYHCSYKSQRKDYLKSHIYRHNFKNVKQEKSHHCDKCDYETYASTHLKNHKLTHLKPEEMQYFCCYHCSYKTKWKGPLKGHILRHFKNEEIRFHCYICDFVSLRRDLIIEHIRKHFKNRNKYDETISKYQFESHINNLKKRCPNNLEDHCSTIHFDDHVNHIKEEKSEQPDSTKSFVSRTESVPENSSKSCIFQCTYCPTKFPEEHLLKGHLQLHSSIKGIECPICTYKHNKTEILKHLSWHGANGNESFKCPICDLKKRTKENMDDHLKVDHSKAIYQKHDSVCKKKSCNGFC